MAERWDIPFTVNCVLESELDGSVVYIAGSGIAWCWEHAHWVDIPKRVLPVIDHYRNALNKATNAARISNPNRR